jgi:hypothetical protein
MHELNFIGEGRCIINLRIDKPYMDYSRDVAECVRDFFN